MKLITGALVIALFILGARGASADGDMGNPFVYAPSTASYLTGEPNGTYTSSGTPPTANVTVGAQFVFNVYNSDMFNYHTARTMYSVVCNLGTSPENYSDTLHSVSAYGPFDEVIYANMTYYSYTGTNQAEGNVPQWVGNDYVANAYIAISDEKTTDNWTFNLSTMDVQVN
jgi:hypothetical protein